MVEQTKKQLIKTLEYYKFFGLSKNYILKDGEVVDLYQLLGVKPQFNADGGRALTPYEIIGVPPIFIDGKEVPIVFAIKNKTSKIGKPTFDDRIFVYKSGKIKDKKSILEELKENYKKAVLFGNEADAEKFLNLIDQLTNGGAEAFLDTFYDYTRFYRRMKKQLIIDMFAHFFMMYMRNKSITVKRGIIKKGKIYKAYKDKTGSEYESDYSQDMSGIFPDIAMPDLPNIKSVVIEREDEEEKQTPSQTNNGMVNITSTVSPNIIPPPPMPIFVDELENFGVDKQVDGLDNDRLFKINDIILDENGNIYLEGVNDLKMDQEPEKLSEKEISLTNNEKNKEKQQIDMNSIQKESY